VLVANLFLPAAATVTRKSCGDVYVEDVISSDEEEEEHLFHLRERSYWNWNKDATPLFPQQFPKQVVN
jgi:hypothetical protein